MKLTVRVIEARNLLAMDLNGLSDPYVKLQLGKFRHKTKVVEKSLNPSWDEEFCFLVDDLSEELNVSVLDEDRYFNDDFIGQVKIPISTVFDAENKTLGSSWYQLQPKSKKAKSKDCGEILLCISLSLKSHEAPVTPVPDVLEQIKDIPNGTPNETSPDTSFDQLLKKIELKDQGDPIPENLSGGIVLDQVYAVSPGELNEHLFSPSSNFLQSLAELQGSTGLDLGQWAIESSGRLQRVVTCTKAATKLVKAVKATEEHTYIKADGKAFAILASVSTPDVPFGGSFKTELLYSISPGPELPSEQQSSRLTVSWRMNFLQSTMMKGVIENGARQGIKDSFSQFQELLSKNIKPVDLKDIETDKEQILASLKAEQESDWKLAFRFLGNFTVLSSAIAILYILTHIMLSNPDTVHGLEFVGLDLPDSVGEMVVCGILVLQGERALKMIGRFLQARKQKDTDHGKKARGDGWLLTVALIEGSSLAAVDSAELCDPYVVFTCNSQTKTSSIKFHTPDPQWNEIFEFDAMDDPPSVMDVDVYDFDGPFDEAAALGHAEVNFVKSNLADLADLYIPLQGKLAQACQSKLHLRIFLNNSRGSSTKIVEDYLMKVQKEVGKKINIRSPQTNSAFQKLFNLPVEEFLINDFTCHLKRKMPMQGRLFLSPRIIGFHANLFGHKTKFFFLWEDIEDIQVVSPTLASVGSPSLLITLRRGRGEDARHGAKTVDVEGRLKFHFQSFVSFQAANRTIMALWKAKSLSPEQKVQIVEEESESKSLQHEESGSFLGMEEAMMEEVFCSSIPVSVNLLMELFSGGLLDRKVMEKVGCVDYNITTWEPVKSDSDLYQRQVNYKFHNNISRYGGEVTSTQQKSQLERNSWLIEEVMTFQGVPFGEFFTLHLRYQVDEIPTRSNACNVQVSLGITWLKSTKHQKRITTNVRSNLADRLKDMFNYAEQFITGR